MSESPRWRTAVVWEAEAEVKAEVEVDTDTYTEFETESETAFETDPELSRGEDGSNPRAFVGKFVGDGEQRVGAVVLICRVHDCAHRHQQAARTSGVVRRGVDAAQPRGEGGAGGAEWVGEVDAVP